MDKKTRLTKKSFIKLMRSLAATANIALELPRYAKRSIAICLDAALCFLTLWAALLLRLGEFVTLEGTFLVTCLLSVAIALPLFIVFGLYRAIFRYSGWPALFTILQSLAIYTILFATIITAIGIPGVPRTVGLIQPLLLFFAIGGSRAVARFWLGGIYRSRLKTPSLPKALIYGAGNTGRQLAMALTNTREMQCVGFLDDDTKLHGQSLNSYPIYDPSQLADLIESKGVTHILLAFPSASRRRRNDVIKRLKDYPVSVRTLPSVSDLAEGRVTMTDLRELDIDDLLGRDAVKPNQALMAQNIKEQTVLVTGAGGSIGSELCRQIIRLSPKRLILLDMNEYSLYSIHAELESFIQNEGNINCDHDFIIPLLASVLDQDRLKDIMDHFRPDTVYHAAAYKHVPLVEQNLSIGIRNNVFGTLNTARAAQAVNVKTFVMVSTDKAVRPTNAMGASKRLAELCLQALSDKATQSSKHTCFSMVRFGNVLDSSGSVIPRFRKQIKDGGPITLTHPDITRYFMTIPEAAQLVIQAGSMGKGGDIFVLDMGKPIKIQYLAHRMALLSGRTIRDENTPEGDIDIVITGLRPGEKLYEELMLGDNPQATDHRKIQRAQDPYTGWNILKHDLRALESFIDENNVKAIVQQLQDSVTEYTPKGHIVDWMFSKGNSYQAQDNTHLKIVSET